MAYHEGNGLIGLSFDASVDNLLDFLGQVMFVDVLLNAHPGVRLGTGGQVNNAVAARS